MFGTSTYLEFNKYTIILLQIHPIILLIPLKFYKCGDVNSFEYIWHSTMLEFTRIIALNFTIKMYELNYKLVLPIKKIKFSFKYTMPVMVLGNDYLT